MDATQELVLGKYAVHDSGSGLVRGFGERLLGDAK